MFLDKLKIGPRLMLIVAGTIIGILSVGGYSLFEIRANLFEDRQIKTQHVVDTATAILEYYAAEETAGRMTKADAQEAATAGGFRFQGPGVPQAGIESWHI